MEEDEGGYQPPPTSSPLAEQHSTSPSRAPYRARQAGAEVVAAAAHTKRQRAYNSASVSMDRSTMAASGRRQMSRWMPTLRRACRSMTAPGTRVRPAGSPSAAQAPARRCGQLVPRMQARTILLRAGCRILRRRRCPNRGETETEAPIYVLSRCAQAALRTAALQMAVRALFDGGKTDR